MTAGGEKHRMQSGKFDAAIPSRQGNIVVLSYPQGQGKKRAVLQCHTMHSCISAMHFLIHHSFHNRYPCGREPTSFHVSQGQSWLSGLLPTAASCAPTNAFRGCVHAEVRVQGRYSAHPFVPTGHVSGSTEGTATAGEAFPFTPAVPMHPNLPSHSPLSPFCHYVPNTPQCPHHSLRTQLHSINPKLSVPTPPICPQTPTTSRPPQSLRWHW